MYDYLIVGAGLFGATFARIKSDEGKKCLIIDRRNHIGGNCYTKNVEEIEVHTYGPHIFHTNNAEVWRFANKFADFNRFTNSPVANFKGKLYNLPFNMNTFYQMWGATTPQEAQNIINAQKKEYFTETPRNLEEQALNLVGCDVYEALIKGYTEKQWGRPCRDLPPEIIKRLPLRFVFDNNYFNAEFQGIPKKGYTAMFEKMLEGIEVIQSTDFLTDREYWRKKANKILYTGMIDEFFQYTYGELEYRSVRFETDILDTPNFQGVAVVNYTDAETPYTRIIEHKHFNFGTQPKTVISREFSAEWQRGDEPFYPINDAKNNQTYQKYQELAKQDKNILFGGRLASYQYLDMDATIERALNIC